RRGLYEMAVRNLSFSSLERIADQDDGPFGDHLRRIGVLLDQDPQISAVLKGVLNGQPCPTPDSFYRLRSAGILSGPSSKDARFRCQLYANYLRRRFPADPVRPKKPSK